MSSNERFRNEFATKILDILPADYVAKVMNAFDATSYDYDIERKKMELITIDDMPEIVKNYIASKAIAGKSFDTLCQYKFALQHFFTTVKKPFNNIQTDDIRMYLNWYKQTRNVSNAYANQIRIKLNGFFQWLVNEGRILRNPCAPIETIKSLKKTREPFTAYQLEHIRWDATQINIRTRALVDFLFSTGMRVNECAHVKLTDINWQERSVLIRHGKGDKERYVYFNATSEFTLRKYIETRTDTVNALFVSMKKPHQQLKKRALEVMLNKVGISTNLHIHPHRFRRSFATRSIESGMPLETLQALMGHEDPKTTLIYVQQSQQNIQHEHRRIYA